MQREIPLFIRDPVQANMTNKMITYLKKVPAQYNNAIPVQHGGSSYLFWLPDPDLYDRSPGTDPDIRSYVMFFLIKTFILCKK